MDIQERCTRVSSAIAQMLQYETTSNFGDGIGPFSSLAITGIRIAQIPQKIASGVTPELALQELQERVHAISLSPLGNIKEKIAICAQTSVFPLRRSQGEKETHATLSALIGEIEEASGVHIDITSDRSGANHTRAFRLGRAPGDTPSIR